MEVVRGGWSGCGWEVLVAKQEIFNDVLPECLENQLFLNVLINNEVMPILGTK